MGQAVLLQRHPRCTPSYLAGNGMGTGLIPHDNTCCLLKVSLDGAHKLLVSSLPRLKCLGHPRAIRGDACAPGRRQRRGARFCKDAGGMRASVGSAGAPFSPPRSALKAILVGTRVVLQAPC